MMKKYTELSLEGNIVLLPVDVKDIPDFDEEYGEEEEYSEQLMELHKAKIDMASEVFVINENGYIGRGTFEEVGYSTVTGKKISYLEPLDFEGEEGGKRDVCRKNKKISKVQTR